MYLDIISQYKYGLPIDNVTTNSYSITFFCHILQHYLFSSISHYAQETINKNPSEKESFNKILNIEF